MTRNLPCKQCGAKYDSDKCLFPNDCHVQHAMTSVPSALAAARNAIPDLESLLSRHEALKAAMREKAREWRKEARDSVPPEYAGRNMHYKYLKMDNYAAGQDDCADELEALAEKQP